MPAAIIVYPVAGAEKEEQWHGVGHVRRVSQLFCGGRVWEKASRHAQKFSRS